MPSHNNNLDHNFGHISSFPELSCPPFSSHKFNSQSFSFLHLYGSHLLHLSYSGCVYAYVWRSGQLVGASSLLPLYGFQGLNSGCQPRWQVPLATKPSPWAGGFKFYSHEEKKKFCWQMHSCLFFLRHPVFSY